MLFCTGLTTLNVRITCTTGSFLKYAFRPHVPLQMLSSAPIGKEKISISSLVLMDAFFAYLLCLRLHNSSQRPLPDRGNIWVAIFPTASLV